MNPLKRLYHHHGVSDPRFYLNNRVHESCDHGCRGHRHSAEFLLQQKSNYQTFLDKYNIEMNACTQRGGWYFGVSSPKVLLCDTNKADCSSVMSWEMASHSLALWWPEWNRPRAIFWQELTIRVHRSRGTRKKKKKQSDWTLCTGTMSSPGLVFSHTALSANTVFISTQMFWRWQIESPAVYCVVFSITHYCLEHSVAPTHLSLSGLKSKPLCL